MKNHSIHSPMARGNGAYIVHRSLERRIPGYRVVGYNAYWTLLPFALPVLARTVRPQIIHTTPDYGFFFRRKSIPLVLSFHNFVLDPWMRQHSSWLQKVHYATDLKVWTCLAVDNAQEVTAVSRFTAQLAQKTLGLSRPIRVIYNGVDAEHFRPRTSRLSKGHEFRAFFSGNLTRRKGAQWLGDIKRHLNPGIRIYYTKGLRGSRNLEQASGLTSLGAIPFEDMPKRYHEMDLLLMPTVREGLSLAVLEAMACGLPVVASWCSSLPEQIDEGKGGFLCPVGDARAFAEKINLLAESSRLTREMGQYNRAKVEQNFTVGRMAAEYRQVFEEVLAGDV